MPAELHKTPVFTDGKHASFASIVRTTDSPRMDGFMRPNRAMFTALSGKNSTMENITPALSENIKKNTRKHFTFAASF